MRWPTHLVLVAAVIGVVASARACSGSVGGEVWLRLDSFTVHAAPDGPAVPDAWSNGPDCVGVHRTPARHARLMSFLTGRTACGGSTDYEPTSHVVVRDGAVYRRFVAQGAARFPHD